MSAVDSYAMCALTAYGTMYTVYFITLEFQYRILTLQLFHAYIGLGLILLLDTSVPWITSVSVWVVKLTCASRDPLSLHLPWSLLGGWSRLRIPAHTLALVVCFGVQHQRYWLQFVPVLLRATWF